MINFSFDDRSWDDLFKKLDKLERNVPRVGRRIMFHAVENMNDAARSHLATQGRGGYPPPLSEMTKVIYSIDGEPDGSGIHDNMEMRYYQEGKNFYAVLGILEGKPTMIAKVQNDGCIIPVTEKMRGYFAATYGIGLKKETTHLIVPGRKFWDESWKIAKDQAVKDLSHFFKDVLN